MAVQVLGELTGGKQRNLYSAQNTIPLDFIVILTIA